MSYLFFEIKKKKAATVHLTFSLIGLFVSKYKIILF